MNSALDQFERQLVAASLELSNPEETPVPIATTPLGRRRRTLRVPPKRLLLSFAAMIVAAGGVATAGSLLFPSQRLANGKVNCFMATHGTGVMDGHTLAVGGGTTNGQPPISFCRTWYRRNDYRLNGSMTGPRVAGLPLIACQENATTVGVYVATGRPDQCQSLHEKPLPNTYAAAAARLRSLQQALLAIQYQRDCASVTSIAQQTRTLLTDRGFTHWRVITPPSDPGRHWLFGYALPAGTGGTCGTLVAANSPYGDPVDIDTQRQTVTVSVSPPRTIEGTVNRVMDRLVAQASTRCYTTTSIRSLARRLLAGTTLRPLFAAVAREQGLTYVPALTERLFEHGCVHPSLAIAGNNNRFVDILLSARNAPRLPASQVYPPARAFHP
jgi:hypothetical protein